MSAERLREAAALMRERAEGATGDRWGWRHFGDDPENSCRVVRYPIGGGEWSVVADDIWTPENATHIASWHPAVALAVANWLDAELRAITGSNGTPHDDAITPAALALANTYLNTT